MLKVVCADASEQVTVFAGTGEPLNIIWPKGYLFKPGGATWLEFDYTGTQERNWLISNAYSILPASDAELQQPNYVAAYYCSYDDTIADWRCGCRERESCGNVGKWSLQAFQK